MYKAKYKCSNDPKSKNSSGRKIQKIQNIYEEGQIHDELQKMI